MQRTLISLLLGLSASAAFAQTEVTATLAGHAFVPVNTLVQAPKAAGPLFETSGKFANDPRVRVEQLGSVVANTFVGDPKHPRASGGTLPVKGQVVQGFSGIQPNGDGTFLTLTDNGFGNKVNSMDALLMVHSVKPDWKSGKVKMIKTTFLHDPDRKVPFFIQNENSHERYLTGSDFDVESIQVVGKEWWIGDEFGPYILRTTPQGKVLGVIETVVGARSSPALIITSMPARRCPRPCLSRCVVPVASSPWRSPRMAKSSTPCSSGRFGTRKPRPTKATTASHSPASSNSTWPASNTAASNGNTNLSRPAMWPPISRWSTSVLVW